MAVSILNPYDKSVPNSKYSANNPYVGVEYKKSGWQNFLSSLGIRTQADAWQENMQVQANEWESAMQMKLRDEEYNSPTNQVARMKAAGINPDLNGGQGIDSGSAAQMPEDPSTPMQTTGDEQQIMSVASGIMSCFSTALGMVSTVQGIQRSSLENSLLDLEGDERIQQLVEKMAPTFVVPYGENNDMHPQEFLDNAYARAQIWSKKNLPKKYRQGFNSSIENFFSSAPGDAKAYEEWFNDIQKQKDFHRGYNTFYSPSPKIMKRIYEVLGNLEEDLYKMRVGTEGDELDARSAEAGERIAEAEFNEKVYDKLDPNSEAGARNSEAKARKDQADITHKLRGSVNEILDALQHDNSQFSNLFGFLLRIYSLYMFMK